MKSFISYKQPIIIPDPPIATVPQGIVVPGKAVTEVRRKGGAGQSEGGFLGPEKGRLCRPCRSECFSLCSSLVFRLFLASSITPG